jgi:hypothetical protein
MTHREREHPIPEKIETICECGAMFKSIPMMCSECGKIFSEEYTATEES